MLIHGDGNSNILLGDLFKSEEFIKKANPDIVLMNPPYNAKPKDIPDKYKKSWSSKQSDGKEDATKGFCFVQFIADVIKDMNEQNEECNKPRKEVKMAVLLPVSAAIGNNMVLKQCKTETIWMQFFLCQQRFSIQGLRFLHVVWCLLLVAHM